MKNINHDRDQKEENVRDEIDNFLDDIKEEDTDVEIGMKEFQKNIAKLKCKKCNSSNMIIIKKNELFADHIVDIYQCKICGEMLQLIVNNEDGSFYLS